MEQPNLSLWQLGRMMHVVFRAFKRRAAERMDEAVRVSPEQFSILYAITLKEEEVIQKDLAEMMGKDKSVVLRLVDSLEEKELVRRVVDLKDRRKNYLMVTKSGDRVMKQYLEIFSELEDDIRQGLTPSDIVAFRKVVTHILRKAETL